MKYLIIKNIKFFLIILLSFFWAATEETVPSISRTTPSRIFLIAMKFLLYGHRRMALSTLRNGWNYVKLTVSPFNNNSSVTTLLVGVKLPTKLLWIV